MTENAIAGASRWLRPARNFDLRNGFRLFADTIGVVLIIGVIIWNFALTVSADVLSVLNMFQLIILSILSLCGLFLSIARQRPVFMISFYFALIFFVMAPLQQLRIFFDPLMAEESTQSIAFMLCNIFVVLNLIGLLTKYPTTRRNTHPKIEVQRFTGALKLILVSLISTLIVISTYASSLFSNREAASDAISSQFGTPMQMIITGFIAPLAFYSALVGLWVAWNSPGYRGWVVSFVLALLGAAVANNPTVTSRYQFGTFVFASIFLFWGRRKCRLLLAVLMFGTAASALFQGFRSIETDINIPDFDSFFATMDYDAFSMLCHTIVHVRETGWDYCMNIISAILFFVPREIWTYKNQPTPFYMLDTLQFYRGLWSYNLSEPLIAEGYFAFGFIGAIGVTSAQVLWVRYIEKAAEAERLSAVYLFSCACPTLMFMLMRGSLIVGMSAIMGHYLAIWFSIYMVQYMDLKRSGTSKYLAL